MRDTVPEPARRLLAQVALKSADSLPPQSSHDEVILPKVPTEVVNELRRCLPVSAGNPLGRSFGEKLDATNSAAHVFVRTSLRSPPEWNAKRSKTENTPRKKKKNQVKGKISRCSSSGDDQDAF
jgi:hypothetical protein